jgi:hypothetical protein
MARLVHDRNTAGLANDGCQVAGALHIVNDGGAGITVQHVHGQKHHDPVSVNDRAAQGHHAQSIGIAIQRQSQIGIHQTNGFNQVFEVFRIARVGVVVGKGAVDFIE